MYWLFNAKKLPGSAYSCPFMVMARFLPAVDMLQMHYLLLQELAHAQLIILYHGRELPAAEKMRHYHVCGTLIIKPYCVINLMRDN